jgi:hypothetical protein
MVPAPTNRRRLMRGSSILGGPPFASICPRHASAAVAVRDADPRIESQTWAEVNAPATCRLAEPGASRVVAEGFPSGARPGSVRGSRDKPFGAVTPTG